MDEAGAEVEALVGAYPPLIQDAWHRIQGWYKAAFDRALPPAWVLALVLRVLRSTHAEVNGMEEEKGENRDGNGDVNGKGRLAGAEQGREQRNDGADDRGRSIRGPTEGRLESKSERGKKKRVNLDVDVETR